MNPSGFSYYKEFSEIESYKSLMPADVCQPEAKR